MFTSYSYRQTMSKNDTATWSNTLILLLKKYVILATLSLYRGKYLYFYSPQQYPGRAFRREVGERSGHNRVNQHHVKGFTGSLHSVRGRAFTGFTGSLHTNRGTAFTGFTDSLLTDRGTAFTGFISSLGTE